MEDGLKQIIGQDLRQFSLSPVCVADSAYVFGVIEKSLMSGIFLSDSQFNAGSFSEPVVNQFNYSHPITLE